MSIHNDYLLDMILRFVESLVAAAQKLKGGMKSDAMVVYEEVVGEVLDMPADACLELTPMSLVTMMQISAVDERLAMYVTYALMNMASIYDGEGDVMGDVRRQQARAVADAYGFPITAVPPEVQDELDKDQG